jgi:membrane-bound serine protease (ClpP class)
MAARGAEQRIDATVFLLLALLLLLFLPGPWNVVAALVALAVGGAEVLYFYRRMRGEKVVTGVENLVGASGQVTTTLAPSGQIRVLGETWEAQAASTVPVGETVRVIAVDGLKLDVEAVPEDPPTHA